MTGEALELRLKLRRLMAQRRVIPDPSVVPINLARCFFTFRCRERALAGPK